MLQWLKYAIGSGCMEKSHKKNGGPAGAPFDTGGQQPGGVIVESTRDQRVLDWLIAQAGPEAVASACAQLSGNRRPFPSNIAKALGLTPPTDLAFAPKATVKVRLAEACSLLRKRS